MPLALLLGWAQAGLDEIVSAATASAPFRCLVCNAPLKLGDTVVRKPGSGHLVHPHCQPLVNPRNWRGGIGSERLDLSRDPRFVLRRRRRGGRRDSGVGTLDERLAHLLGIGGECLVCGGPASRVTDRRGRLVITCWSGQCKGTFGHARAPLATWLQYRRAAHGYETTKLLYAVKHALRHVQAGLLAPAKLDLNRQVRRAMRAGDDRLALAIHALSVFVAARLYAAPDLSRNDGITFSPGFIAAHIRTPEGERISRHVARTIVTKLKEFGLLLERGRTTLTKTFHDAPVYALPVLAEERVRTKRARSSEPTNGGSAFLSSGPAQAPVWLGTVLAAAEKLVAPPQAHQRASPTLEIATENARRRDAALVVL